MADLVDYEVRDTVAVLTMDDGKANALSYDMLSELHSALDRAQESTKGVVLAGRPGKFCGGFDLKVMMSGAEAAAKLVGTGAELYMRLYEFPLPVVAACTGHAMAGGALLLLVSDSRVGADGDFKIGLNEVAIGLPLPILAQELARDRLAPRQLTEATIQAQVYSPDAAAEIGYLDQLVEPDEVEARAVEQAQRLAGLPGPAYAKTKARIRSRTIGFIRETLAADLEGLTIG